MRGRLSWLPYARSGDPRLFKRHDAATRRMIDASFCHFVSEDVALKATGRGDVVRRRGFWPRGALPWAGYGLVILDYSIQPHQWYVDILDKAKEELAACGVPYR